MWQTIGGLVIGVATVYFGNLVTRGGPAARALGAARHELEVAALLDDGDELASRLKAKANTSIERYLNPRGWETREGKAAAIASVLATLAAFLGLLIGAAQIDGQDLSFWQSTGLGGLLGISWHVIRWAVREGVLRCLHRLS